MTKSYNQRWLGRQVKIVLKASKMSRKELAERAGMGHPNAVGELINGKKNPTWRTILRICDALEITPYDLIVAGTPLAGLPHEGPRSAAVKATRRQVIETHSTVRDFQDLLQEGLTYCRARPVATSEACPYPGGEHP